jgi:hypothetical protein
MTPEFWIQLTTLLLGGAGALGAVYGVLNNRISGSAAKLHERVDRAEAADAEIRRDYVRRDDLREDIRRLERSQEAMTAKVDQMIANLVPVLARLAEAAISLSSQKPNGQNSGHNS